ncbi:hypothetical protein C8F04DRAFT_1199511 [Mycena alexandri]|uniref:Uncharacterized protein n=1 Tax=Mycena alexandri TaxID=1745969 RepID=A0AAD6RZ73_9AGAR|nr:hypothetical protein C8F04DRAFT_1199511 [Mycena alexandri]
MPARDFEIFRSGEYWQSLRRAKIAHEARKAQAGPPTIPVLASCDHIYTFTPGRAEPITSLMHANGSVIPISGLPTASSSSSRRPAPTRRTPINVSHLRGTNSAARVAATRQAADEALLLARLAEDPDTRRKRKMKEELTEARRAAKKKFYKCPVVHPSKAQVLKRYGEEYRLSCLTRDTHQFVTMVVRHYLDLFGYQPLYQAFYGHAWVTPLKRHGHRRAFARVLMKQLKIWFAVQDPAWFNS